MANKTLQLECYGVTDIGRARDHNEDVWAANPEKGFFILADGMGGHQCGEVAAKEATDYLTTLFDRWTPKQRWSSSEAKVFFSEAITAVNAYVYKLSLHDDDLKGMGTTLCVLYCLNKEAVVAHVGDSRIYRFRGEKLEALTEDHSLLAELVALGAVDSAEADSFPYKHILTRAIGTQPKVEPTLSIVEVESHDLFLLCSDGLTNYVTSSQISEILHAPATLQEKGDALILAANAGGGGDNITAILVGVDLDLSR